MFLLAHNVVDVVFNFSLLGINLRTLLCFICKLGHNFKSYIKTNIY